MPGKENFTTLEVMGIAIKSEVEAIKLYHRMKETAKSEDLKMKLDFLIDQEKKHEKLLTEAYGARFPDVDLKLPPKSLVPTISDLLERDATLKELFGAALEAEQKSEDFYGGLAKETNDSKSRSLLEYLASMEHSHYAILEAEYHQIQIADEYDSDDYLRGERLMNLGP